MKNVDNKYHGYEISARYHTDKSIARSRNSDMKRWDEAWNHHHFSETPTFQSFHLFCCVAKPGLVFQLPENERRNTKLECSIEQDTTNMVTYNQQQLCFPLRCNAYCT